MAPPIPKSPRTPRRKLLGDGNSTKSQQQNHTDRNEISDVASRLASRRYRDDDSRPTLSGGRYAREARHARHSSLPSSTENVHEDKRNQRQQTSTNTPTKAKSMLTTEDEIQRIREIRARRQRAERQDRGEDQASERNDRGTNLNTSATTRASLRRPTRISSISREDLEKSGLVRRRRQSDSSTPSSMERLNGSGNEHGEINTTKIADRASKLSDIEARLAARRNLRNSGDGTIKSTVAPSRNKSEPVQQSFETSSKQTPSRNDRRRNSHSKSIEEVRRTVPSSNDQTNADRPRRRKSDDRFSQVQANTEHESSERSTEQNSNMLPVTESSESRRRKSNENVLPVTEAYVSRRRKSNENVLSVTESYESRRRKSNDKSETSPRASSYSISERLRERREARERDRKEREKKYDLKGLSKESQPTDSNTTDIQCTERNDNQSVSVIGNSSDNQMPISSLEMPDDEDGVTNEKWSVRLYVISAMDLPSNVVPNMPLCPVLKMGLVPLPADLNDDVSKRTITSAVMEKLGEDGVETVKSAKVRSTTLKILSKRDNGYMDFHQEYRWDNLEKPRMMGMCVELLARAVRTPSNYMLSPPSLSQKKDKNLSEMDNIIEEQAESSRTTGGRAVPAGRGVNRTPSVENAMRALWNRNTKKQEAEMQTAEAAAAVARVLVDDSETENKNDDESKSASLASLKNSDTPNADYNVSLRSDTGAINGDLTKDVRLGSVVIPLSRLLGDEGIKKNEPIRLEQWHELEITKESGDALRPRKKPSFFLEISLTSSQILDDSEDELEEGYVDAGKKESFKASARPNASFARRACIDALYQTDDQETRKETDVHEIKKEKIKTEDPLLEPGIVDFIAVVGCKDIGNQKNDDGMKGWVKTSPESIVLEQFPPNNEFHLEKGRKSLLPEMLQWFCYPEGARLWRGTEPPTCSDLNLKQTSVTSPANEASLVTAFNACLDCSTSFSWFVIASNSDEYGSSLVKTYTAVIRFYVPAPTGIDSTQDDFAQAIMSGKPNLPPIASVKRLWVPIAICLTSNLPIIGTMETLLLRICEELATIPNGIKSGKLEEIQEAIGNVILNYQKPIAGAVNCSIPFLGNDRFHLSLPPSTSLPPLPHGRAIISVCRLIGAEGLNYLIAAVLTECKILLHSQDIAEIAMVAEVITALAYPFTWSLPYIPVLPIGMIEFVEAPLSYLLGIPSCNLKSIDARALDDTVVFDLNKEFSFPEYSLDKVKSKSGANKHPPPLPASVAANISNAVYKLLQAEEQMEEEYGGFDSLSQSFPRLETESLAEREFRVTVAIEICGLLRGYQDCVGPVFNRDKFLKTAPALYEERREFKMVQGRPSSRGGITEKTKIISPRSKRFLSSLVSGQNFQQLLESLDSQEANFFHEILELVDETSSDRKALKRSSSDEFDFSQTEKNVALLMKSLQKNEDKIPTFCVAKDRGLETGEAFEDTTLLSQMYGDFDFDNFGVPGQNNSDALDSEKANSSKFPKGLLSPIEIQSTTEISDSSMQAISMEYLSKLETNPWEYNQLFSIPLEKMEASEKINLREAIGERRFRTWKLSRENKSNHDEELPFLSESNAESAKQGSALDLTTLVTSAKNDSLDSSSVSSDSIQSRASSLTPAQQRIAAAKSRDIIRRCLDRANVAQSSESDQINPFVENGRDLMAEAEKALRNASAQLFLVSILAQRSRLDNKRKRTMRQNATVANSASRLDRIAFDCLIRLSCAMLDACMEYKEFEMAYRLLTNSAGFVMVQRLDNFEEECDDEFGDDQSMIVISMTSRIGLHPIFADIGVWEAVMVLHLRDRKAVKKSDDFKAYDSQSDDEAEEELEYEAAVATLYEMVGYGIPGEELSRFAIRASQKNGWFSDDRGKQLLMLARRISIRRDQTRMSATGNTGDIDMVRKGPDADSNCEASEGSPREKPSFKWRDFAWCHPSAPSRATPFQSDVGNAKLNMVSSFDDKYMKRTPVTALASFGSSIVASGGLDGGIFLAHSITVGSSTEDPKVRGIHLDWGSASRARTGSSSDGEYGVGAVSCLAAAYGDTQHDPNTSSTKDTRDKIDQIDIAESMEGSRIIAGTTAGDLRVWSVKDIYSSISMTQNIHGSRSAQTASRFKYSLRGRALSGHRGGVTCIDVPSQVYRPDALVTGGADGLIKLWALRAPTGSRRTNVNSSNEADLGGSASQHQRGRGGDALSTLSGHAGRILCIKTAWHGDHLISGGADRTIRVWDLATTGGKCIHKLCGHFGWITKVQYWGPNTIVSASTDRSVALWDARVHSSPLFILRNHQSPISDLLVGSRTDPHMVSAAADGTIATWDFRSLSDTTATQQPGIKDSSSSRCKIVRLPSASICHNKITEGRAVGPVHLSRDVTDPINTFLSVGTDAVLRKWDIKTGDMVKEYHTGHCDTITRFESYAQNHGFAQQAIHPNDFGGKNVSDLSDNGYLTSSLDGTIRMRRFDGVCEE